MQVRDIIHTIAKVLWTVIRAIFVVIGDILYYIFLDCDENDLKDDLRESYYWEDHNMYQSKDITDRSDIYYLFFDTETAGLPYDFSASSSQTGNWPRLVQLSWIAQDRHGNTISEGNYIVRPDGFKIPYEASDVHGITTEMALEEVN